MHACRSTLEDPTVGAQAVTATPSDSFYYWNDAWSTTWGTPITKTMDVTQAGSSAPLAGTPGYILNTEMAMGTNNIAHFVYSVYNGSHWVLRYRNSGSTQSKNYETVPLTATNCVDTPWAQVFIKPTSGSDTLAVAYACVTSASGTPCHVFYQERSLAFALSATGDGTPTASAWSTPVQLSATPLQASCSVSSLTSGANGATTAAAGRSFRPTLAVDRRATISGSDAPSTAALKAHVAWYSADDRAIYYASNASGSWSVETAASSLTSGDAGEPTIAIDQTGRSYIVYRDAQALKMVTNNGRAGNASSGSWSAPSTVVSSQVMGVGTAAVNGMAGRTNSGGN